MNCSSGCTTGPHATYGECLRAKNMRVAYCQSAAGDGKDATAQRRWSANLERYRSAVRQGIQPDTTTPAAVRAAEAWSQKNGKPYSEQADTAHRLTVAKELLS